MIKPLNYQKNSFTLIETILAFIIVSVMISSFFKLLVNNEDNTYNNLVKVQNELNSNKSLSINKNFIFEKNQ